MYRIYYAEKDTTLYEKYPNQNTGIDQILELTKIASGSRLDGVIQAKTYNTRILLDFGTEITSLSQSIVDGGTPHLNQGNVTSASVYLNLHAMEASDIQHNYSIHAYNVSESWDNGNGLYTDTPLTDIGSSWYNKSGDNVSTPIPWNTGSAESVTDGVGATISVGGGTYRTTTTSSQTFINTSPDIRMDVTAIIKDIIASGVPNHGIMIKRNANDERSGENLGSLKFFGRESHTIFVPRLEVCWDDVTPGTGNVEVNTISTNTYVPYIKNIKSEYRTNEIARFWVGVRPEFPTKTYQTSSFYMTTDRLPVSSSYSIYDSVTNDVIIKDEDSWGNSTTKMASHASDGNYFDLRMDSFMPERYYKIKLTCRRIKDTQTFDNFYFKVVR